MNSALSAAEITARVCEHFECELFPYLKTVDPSDEEVNNSAR